MHHEGDLLTSRSPLLFYLKDSKRQSCRVSKHSNYIKNTLTIEKIHYHIVSAKKKLYFCTRLGRWCPFISK